MISLLWLNKKDCLGKAVFTVLSVLLLIRGTKMNVVFLEKRKKEGKQHLLNTIYMPSCWECGIHHPIYSPHQFHYSHFPDEEQGSEIYVISPIPDKEKELLQTCYLLPLHCLSCRCILRFLHLLCSFSLIIFFNI